MRHHDGPRVRAALIGRPLSQTRSDVSCRQRIEAGDHVEKPTESPRSPAKKNQIVMTPKVSVPRIPSHRKKLSSETSNPAKGSFLVPTGI
jgi:hypothetical protein